MNNMEPQQSMMSDAVRHLERLSFRGGVLLLFGVILLHICVAALFKERKSSEAENPKNTRNTIFVIPGSRFASKIEKQIRPENDPTLFIQTPDQYGYAFFRTIAEDPFVHNANPNLTELYPEKKNKVISSQEKPQDSSYWKRLLPPYDLSSEPETDLINYPFWANEKNGLLPMKFVMPENYKNRFESWQPSNFTVLQIMEPLAKDLPWETDLVQTCGDSFWDNLAIRNLNIMLNLDPLPKGLIRKSGTVLKVVWGSVAAPDEAEKGESK